MKLRSHKLRILSESQRRSRLDFDRNRTRELSLFTPSCLTEWEGSLYFLRYYLFKKLYCGVLCDNFSILSLTYWSIYLCLSYEWFCWFCIHFMPSKDLFSPKILTIELKVLRSMSKSEWNQTRLQRFCLFLFSLYLNKTNREKDKNGDKIMVH